MKIQENVLVTGADGFIGSHLAEALVKSGKRVKALCQYNSRSSWGWLDQSAYCEDMEVVLGDVRDAGQMLELCKSVDTVFHLAALIAIPYSYQAPRSYLDANVTGTLNLLDAALKMGVKKVIHTSTSEVYGTALRVPIDEEHPLQAQSPYAASKIGADAFALSYHKSFDLPVVVARPFNTYGPRQSARAVIPTIIAQLLSGAHTVRLGRLSPTRDFNFVADTCRGFLLLADCPAAMGKAINIGSGKEISIGNLVGLIGRTMQIDVNIETEDQRLRPDNSEVERLICDNTLIKNLTNFESGYSLEDGLRTTVSWMSIPQNLAHYKSRIYNV
ncbi:NAD-dependent 4,6-dehydratase LegB [Alphaproteobacteria bacterium]|nr:NAD-dependent 4,6-dehydratase LegB [Alphaproteobacteria bacterium]